MSKIKRIITEEIENMLNESVDFYIQDYDYNLPEDIISVGHMLTGPVIEQLWWKNLSPEDKQKYRDEKDPYIFAPDGGTDDVMNFYLAGIPQEMIEPMQTEIKRILDSNDVKILNISREGDRVIRYKLKLPYLEVAPSMNLANGNAVKLLKLMGFEPNSGSLGETDFHETFKIEDLEKRIQRAKYNLDEPDQNWKSSPAVQFGGQSIPDMPMEREQATIYLENLQYLVDYARQRGYPEITIA